MADNEAGNTSSGTGLKRGLLGVLEKAQHGLDGLVARTVGPDLARSRLADGLFGHCDGVDANGARGWAVRLTAPAERVEVEQWVDGVLKARTRADVPREDLLQAGIGDGACAWAMPLALDPKIEGPQKVEFRVRDGALLTDGTIYATRPNDDIAGQCDGVDGDEAFGWAWRPQSPGERLDVEQWVDGALKARTLANLARTDLAEGGIGDGGYGWRMRLALDPEIAGPQKVEFRVRDGAVLANGAFDAERPPPVEPVQAPRTSPVLQSDAVGFCDGIERGEAFGWAWRPLYPEQNVEIEQWVDGQRAATMVASMMRADLEADGVGHGRYGWRMRLALNPEQVQKQSIEFRIKNAGVVGNGVFELSYADVAPASEDSDQRAAQSIVGVYDSLKGSLLHGWARNLAAPDDPVVVELWVDGAYVCETAADEFRPDLRATGVGHGRYGWRLPVTLDPARKTPLQIEVRVKGGALLENGAFELRNNLLLDDPANAAFIPFVNAVLNSSERAPAPSLTMAAERTTFIVYCPDQREAGDFWAREYDDYQRAAAAFADVLRDLGAVTTVGSEADAEAARADCAAANETCVLISFAPPRLAPLGLQCPIIPAFSWAFPTIPTGAWDGDPRSDWRYVLRQTGRAIVFSEFAAAAVRTAMGASYPVAVIPVPIVDRRPVAAPVVNAPRAITVEGVVLDTRDLVMQPDLMGAPPVVWDGGKSAKRTLDVDGVAFTAAFDMYDGRQDWRNLTSAFAIALGAHADAVLVLKFEEAAPGWWRDLHMWLSRMPAFACRVIAVRGPMTEAERRALIAASNWSLSAPKAEGLCLWRQELMGAGRPAIAPRHSATLDYVTEASALIVASEEEAWTWPDEKEDEGFSWTQHPDDVGPTTRGRLSWRSLSEQIARAYQMSKTDTAGYATLSAGASIAARNWGGDAVVRERLDAFLGLNQHYAVVPAPPSMLLRVGAIA